MLVVALLAATAAAFVLTEVLKLQPSPIRAPVEVTRVFSPVCNCRTAVAGIEFRLRERDVLDVSMVDGEDAVVSTIVRGSSHAAGDVDLEWDGRDDAGRVLPEGEYRVRIHLREERETITLPSTAQTRIDVTPPVVESVDVPRRVFSPDGDGVADRLLVSYSLSEDAPALLYVDGQRRGLKRFAQREGRFVWNGKANGRALPAGSYQLAVSAHDSAGNLAERSPEVRVRIRYVALGRNRIEVTAGARFAVRVSSDASEVRWRLAGRSGGAPPGTLLLRAPRQKGQFTLVVSANGHSARAAVFVREAS